MLVVHVQIHVKLEFLEDFKKATLENAKNSLKEPGIARFDLLEYQEDPTRFLLVEAYKTAEAPEAHKETAHYKKWRETVAPMMVEPRTSVKYSNLFPDDTKYQMHGAG